VTCPCAAICSEVINWCSYDKYGTGDDDARVHAGQFFSSSRSSHGGTSAQDFFSFMFGNIFFYDRHGFRSCEFHDSMNSSWNFDFADERTEP
jgi:hypothetical protein